ncbi:hypothetical protein CG51_14540 [Haematobacter missouriensis]|nr:hypothetical protein CG51_14540 [Haematobacter missouriensis]
MKIADLIGEWPKTFDSVELGGFIDLGASDCVDCDVAGTTLKAFFAMSSQPARTVQDLWQMNVIIPVVKGVFVFRVDIDKDDMGLQ